MQPGDRLTGLYQPGQGMRLWRGNQELAMIDDAELARLFFGIWLSPQTSEPALRSALLQKRPAFALTKAELARDCQEWQEWCDRQAGPSPQQEKDGA